MSEFGFDSYEDAGRDERERRADWADHVEHWRQERDDVLNRDAGEHAFWPRHIERVRDSGYADGDPKAASVR